MQVVDTTGAGDCFTGAVAVGILEGMSYQDAMRFAGLTPKPLAASAESALHRLRCHVQTASVDFSACRQDLVYLCMSNDLKRLLTSLGACSCGQLVVCGQAWCNAQPA